MMKLSMVQRATDTTTRDVSIAEVLGAIRNGGQRLRGQIEQIRDALSHGDKQATRVAGERKKQLPAVMWSGSFTLRRNEALVQHSGLLCADLDKLGGALQGVREKLKTSPHLFSLFRSPSGEGLKAVFRVPADASEHAGSFRTVEKHVRELTGVQIDQACRDVARLCFMSFDPEIYVNGNATEITPLPEPVKEKPVQANVELPPDLSLRERLATQLLGPLKYSAEKGGYFCKCPGEANHTNSTGEKNTIVYLGRVPTLDCRHGSCKGIVEAFNAKLRSEIGKAERQARRETPRAQVQEAPGPPPPPYVPPPLDLFPDDVQRFIRAGPATFDVDLAFFLLPILSGGTAMIGNARSIRLKEDYIEPPIIWTANIAPTGDGKSPGLQAGTAPVRMREHELKQKNQEADKKFAEDSAKWDAKSKKDRAGGEKPPKPPLLTCWLDDTTIEAVARRLNDNPRGVALVKDEFSHWFESMDQYHDRGGADVSRWLTIWTGNLFALDRVTGGRSYRIANPRLSITGGAVPDKFKHLLSDDFFVRGLPARFLFAMPTRNQPRKWVDKSIPKEVKAAVNELFAKLVELEPHTNEHDEEWPVLLGLTAEAKKSS